MFSIIDTTPFNHASTSTITGIRNLSQQRLTEVIGRQKLESLWTADHTMEMLLVSGLLGEAAWFANCLGDWKIAFLLSVAEEFRKKNERYVKKSHDHAEIAIEVPEPKQLMKERIHAILKLDENSVVRLIYKIFLSLMVDFLEKLVLNVSIKITFLCL